MSHEDMVLEAHKRVKIVRLRRANESCWSVIIDDAFGDEFIEIYKSECHTECETFKRRLQRSSTTQYIDPLHLIVALTKISRALTVVSQIAAAKDEAPTPGHPSNYATKAHMRAWANEAWVELDHAFEVLCPPDRESAQKNVNT